MASRIEDYGLIGNTHTAALVSRSGSIDWLCVPRFDSDACFAGRIDEAEALFDRLLALRNHLGLFSEEYDPKLRRQIGNFPQAFTHLAFISTAQVIESVRQSGNVRAPLRGAMAGSAH